MAHTHWVQQLHCCSYKQRMLTLRSRKSLKGRQGKTAVQVSLQLPSSPAMLIRRPQKPCRNQPKSVVPESTTSPLSQKRWLDQDSGGAVGLGIVVDLHKSMLVNSPAKLIVRTAMLEITSLRSSGCRAESRRHGHSNERSRDERLFSQLQMRSSKEENIVPAGDFLSNCFLCRKDLHGKDVYMYQEKGFCSMECRYQQIASDELQEKCRQSKMSKTSCSSCSSDCRLFYTGIIAT